MTAPWNALHPILDAIPDPACCHAKDAVAVVEAEGSGAMGRSISKLSGGYGHAKADSVYHAHDRDRDRERKRRS